MAAITVQAMAANQSGPMKSAPRPRNKQRGRCDRSGREATENEGALAPRRLARVSVGMRSYHGCDLSVYGLCSELRPGLRHSARSCAGPGSAPAGPPPAPFSAGLCLARVSVRMRSRHVCDLFVYGLCSELRPGLRQGAGAGAGPCSAHAGPARAAPLSAGLWLLAASIPNRAAVSAGGSLTSH